MVGKSHQFAMNESLPQATERSRPQLSEHTEK